jgi:glyoxylase-like metal-dependent hydrolase (beta-lactamase superfamily II)
MRALKNLFVFIVIVAVLGGGAVAALRIARQKPSTPEEIKPNLMAVSAAGTYVYAARVGSKVIFFDTGADPAGSTIDTALGALRAGRGDVSDLFLTHGHGDHTAGASGLSGARVHLGAADVPLAEGKAPPDSLVARIMAKAMAAPPISVSNPLTGVVVVDVGDGKSVKAFPVPGHTQGSYVFLYDGVLFGGDTLLLKQGRLDKGPSFFDSNTEEAKASIRSLKQELTGAELSVVCTGHGGCTPVGLGRSMLEDFVGRLGG